MQINSNYIMIDNSKNLELAFLHLRNSEILSVDTESSGYFTYYPRVCLIQITAGLKNYIFDPLRLQNLDPLGILFKESRILKIFHSAQDDIRALKSDFGYEFKNIADTMLSSRYLGMEHNSLSSLVEHYHGVKLEKEFQKSNWETRPLKPKQLEYAALDTAYLESIWQKMESELTQKRILEEVNSEFEFIAREQNIAQKGSDSFHLSRFPDILNYTPLDRGKIYFILKFREEKAKKLNRVPFRVLNNECIKKLISREMSEENFIQYLGKKDGSELYHLMQTQTIHPIEASELNRRIEEDLPEEKQALFRQFKKWKEYIQKIRKIEHSLLPSAKSFLEMIQKHPENLEDLKAMNLMSDWKVENYGPSLLAVLKGEPFEDKIPKGLPVIGSKKGIPNKKPNKENKLGNGFS